MKLTIEIFRHLSLDEVQNLSITDLEAITPDIPSEILRELFESFHTQPSVLKSELLSLQYRYSMEKALAEHPDPHALSQKEIEEIAPDVPPEIRSEIASDYQYNVDMQVIHLTNAQEYYFFEKKSLDPLQAKFEKLIAKQSKNPVKKEVSTYENVIETNPKLRFNHQTRVNYQNKNSVDINSNFQIQQKMRDFFRYNATYKISTNRYDVAYLPTRELGKNVSLLTPLQASITSIMYLKKTPQSVQTISHLLPNYSIDEIKDAFFFLSRMQALIEFEQYTISSTSQIKTLDTFSYRWNYDHFNSNPSSIIKDLKRIFHSPKEIEGITIQEICNQNLELSYQEIKNEILTLLKQEVLVPIYEHGRKITLAFSNQLTNDSIFYMTKHGMTLDEYWLDIDEKYTRTALMDLKSTLNSTKIASSFSTVRLENISESDRILLNRWNIPDIQNRIQLNDQGLIISLDLSLLNLTKLPPQLESLSHLEELNLDENKFQIFPELSVPTLKILSIIGFPLKFNENENISLPHLISLKISLVSKDLSHLSQIFPNLEELVFFTSEIANWEQLSELSHLEKLKIIFCGIKDINTIPILPNLKKLNLDHNYLTSIPENLLEFSSLEILSIKHNEITTFPGIPARFDQIKQLDLSFNYLKEISRESCIFPNVFNLDLSNNEITIILPMFFQNTHLQILNLNGNHLKTSSLTSDFEDLVQLRFLLLNFNEISDIPLVFHSLNLYHLELRYNAFTSIPNRIDLPNLHVLDLSFNIFSSILTNIHGYDNLEELILNGNRFLEFPSDLTQFRALKRLSLSNNNIRYIPDHIEASSNIVFLDLDNNNLSQIVNLCKITSLEILFLNGNPLKKLPSEIGHLQELQGLYIDQTDMNDLPFEIGDLPNLITIVGPNNPWMNEWAAAISILNEESLVHFQSIVSKIKYWLNPKEIIKNLSRDIAFPTEDNDYNILAKDSVIRLWWETNKDELNTIQNTASHSFTQWLAQFERFLDGKWTHP